MLSAISSQPASLPRPAVQPASLPPGDTVTLSTGPIPDYAPLSGVVVHAALRDLCQPLVNTLRDTLGDHLQSEGIGYNGGRGGYTDLNLVWMRDYKPTYVHQADGTTKVVTFASEVPQRSFFTDATYIPVQPPAPDMMFYRIPGQSMGGQWLKTEKVPLLHEDGNLVPAGDHVFVTDKLFADNATPHPELRAAGYQPRSEAEVRDMFCKALDIEPSKLVVMPRMPGEKTGHQDLYLMALGPNEVMLPQIPDEALNILDMGHEVQMGRTVQHFLDDQAARLQGMGFQVDRLPMMAPTFLTQDDRSPTGWFGHFDSPANALLLNYGDKHQVELPTVKLDGFPDGYKAMSARYQQQWADFFKTRGYQPALIDGTDLSQGYGLFRCVTDPVPEVSQ